LEQIALALSISDQTVKNHITAILQKLGVNDRTAAVVHALREQWIALEPPGSQTSSSCRVVVSLHPTYKKRHASRVKAG